MTSWYSEIITVNGYDPFDDEVDEDYWNDVIREERAFDEFR